MLKHSTFFDVERLDMADFHALCEQTTHLEDYPLAADVVDNIVIYDGEQVRAMIGSVPQEQALKAELGRCLKDGPGVFVVKGAYPDLSVIDRCTVAFQEIVAEEAASSQGKGDHAAALPSLAKMSGSGTLCKRLVCMIKSCLLSITATPSSEWPVRLG